jgi:hypothetical protein
MNLCSALLALYLPRRTTGTVTRIDRQVCWITSTTPHLLGGKGTQRGHGGRSAGGGIRIGIIRTCIGTIGTIAAARCRRFSLAG